MRNAARRRLQSVIIFDDLVSFVESDTFELDMRAELSLLSEVTIDQVVEGHDLYPRFGAPAPPYMPISSNAAALSLGQAVESSPLLVIIIGASGIVLMVVIFVACWWKCRQCRQDDNARQDAEQNKQSRKILKAAQKAHKAQQAHDEAMQKFQGNTGSGQVFSSSTTTSIAGGSVGWTPSRSRSGQVLPSSIMQTPAASPLRAPNESPYYVPQSPYRGQPDYQHQHECFGMESQMTSSYTQTDPQMSPEHQYDPSESQTASSYAQPAPDAYAPHGQQASPQYSQHSQYSQYQQSPHYQEPYPAYQQPAAYQQPNLQSGRLSPAFEQAAQAAYADYVPNPEAAMYSPRTPNHVQIDIDDRASYPMDAAAFRQAMQAEGGLAKGLAAPSPAPVGQGGLQSPPWRSFR